MKVALFYPKPTPEGDTVRLPYSLLHLRSFLKARGVDGVEIYDESKTGDIKKLISGLEGRYSLFGISSMTGPQINFGLNIAGMLKKRYPEVPVVWGGWHPTLTPDMCLQNPLVDIVVRGQGEETLLCLHESLSEDKPDLSAIEGISYRKDGRVFHNQERKLSNPLADLRIDYSGVDVEKYLFVQPWGDRAIGAITSLGCPFHCGFCAVAEVYKRRFIFRNIDYVLDELEWMKERNGINAVTFDDDNFFIKRNQTIDFCERMIARGLVTAWDAGAHAALLLKAFSLDDMKIVKESGCRQIYIGAETASEEMLTKMQKKATVRHTYDFVNLMKKAGITPFLSTMVCFPGMNERDAQETINLIMNCKSISPDLGCRVFFYTPYPATRMYEDAVKFGMTPPKTMEEWAGHTLRKFHAPWISKKTRVFVRRFIAYYFPLSVKPVMGKSRLKYFLRHILHYLVRFRIKNGFYALPLDAIIVTWWLKRTARGVVADYEI